ncbi:MAG: hypothetical protein J7K73_03710 [Nanoarchaeota archaeon]|nr:hypothetical protein [Nanoarchaeota archaeon]
MKASIEFSTRQVIILIIMVLIAVLVITLAVKYGNNVKDVFGKLLAAGGSIA